ncbi:MAG: ornithine cyclodeaminase family protein, partial [Gammaproteobacteria bacterium]|nr:ornithine cyclodeaminase family protein [Gammaproteobacteria bacterium]
MQSSLLFIDGQTVQELAPISELIEWMREAMIMTSGDDVELPMRRGLDLPGGMGVIGIMPGYAGGKVARAGVKLVSLVPPERRKGSSHLGLMVLYDADGLQPIAILCGATVTAIRTSAVSAVATDVFALPESTVLTILGAGEQAYAHAVALRQVRPFEEFRVWNHRRESAMDLAAELSATYDLPFRVFDSVAEAVAGADVICTVSSAQEPILTGSMVGPGTHINLVGSSHRHAAEVDANLVKKALFFVDYRPSTMDQAGELLRAIELGIVGPDHVRAELGEVLNGSVRGRTDPTDITIYKSVGVATQDILTAHR